MIAQKGRHHLSAEQISAAQDLDQLFELEPHLVNELLTLIEVDLRIIAGEAVARAADGKALFIQQAAYLPDDQHVLPLIIPAVAAALDRLQLREFLFPVAQDVGLYAAEIAGLTDGEIALSRNRRQFAIVAWFQHTPRRGPSISGPDGK